MMTLKEREESIAYCLLTLAKGVGYSIACPSTEWRENKTCHKICDTLFPAVVGTTLCPCDIYPRQFVVEHYWQCMNPF